MARAAWSALNAVSSSVPGLGAFTHQGARLSAAMPVVITPPGPPTLAVDLPPDSPVLRDEIFGPVLAVERFKSIEAACDAVEA